MDRPIAKRWFCRIKEQSKRMATASLAVVMLVSSFPLGVYAQQPAANGAVEKPAKAASRPVGRPVRHNPSPDPAAQLPDSIAIGAPLTSPAEVVEDEIQLNDGHMEVTPVDTVDVDLNTRQLREELPQFPRETIESDSTFLTAGEAWEADSLAMLKPQKEDEWQPREFEFNPDPTKAVWFAALFPGLGQVYNRRYWKLPIIVGGYLGLAYATNWNSSMLTDYTKAYADLLDNDPDTRSYMDLFSPNVKEENIDKSWLRNVLRSRKNYFRRNRDLCIISMVGVYLLAMVDAYVDASLSHFDITPDLTMDLAPALMQDGRQRYPSVGLVWALNF